MAASSLHSGFFAGGITLLGVRHYDQEEYHLAHQTFLERRGELGGCNTADTECRILCEFSNLKEYEYLNYKESPSMKQLQASHKTSWSVEDPPSSQKFPLKAGEGVESRSPAGEALNCLGGMRGLKIHEENKSSRIYTLLLDWPHPSRDHYMQVLVCQHECVRDLATRPGRLSPIDNYLPLHYDFLQFAYYRVGDYKQALECARSYLLFHPEDEDVLDNESYYETLLEGSEDLAGIEPREYAVMFLQRHQLEAYLLQTAAEGLGFSYTEPSY
uniref:Uncharacterized protein n=1 Tax=Sphaerodactylus townsendi TaxID=933632 RepID=A0ACB8FCJ1_9SAUR